MSHERKKKKVQASIQRSDTAVSSHAESARPTGCRRCKKIADAAYNAKEKARVKRRMRQAKPSYRLNKASLAFARRAIAAARKLLNQ